MLKYTFETHLISNSDIPFIFHHIKLDPNQNSTANWHINIEILYCVDGSGEVICDAKRLKFQKGGIVVINSELFHKVITDSFLDYYCLIIGNDFCRENGIFSESTLFDEIIEDKAAADEYRKVINAFGTDKNPPVPETRHAVLGLLINLYRNHARCTDYSKINSDIKAQHIKAAVLYIKQHYAEKLTLEEIAKQTNVSRCHLAHEFKIYTGQTVFEHINIIRCNEAKRMIKNGMRVTQAAISAGFENMSYFSRTYKKYMSRLPSEDK